MNPNHNNYMMKHRLGSWWILCHQFQISIFVKIFLVLNIFVQHFRGDSSTQYMTDTLKEVWLICISIIECSFVTNESAHLIIFLSSCSFYLCLLSHSSFSLKTLWTVKIVMKNNFWARCVDLYTSDLSHWVKTFDFWCYMRMLPGCSLSPFVLSRSLCHVGGWDHMWDFTNLERNPYSVQWKHVKFPPPKKSSSFRRQGQVSILFRPLKKLCSRSSQNQECISNTSLLLT